MTILTYSIQKNICSVQLLGPRQMPQVNNQPLCQCGSNDSQGKNWCDKNLGSWQIHLPESGGPLLDRGEIYKRQILQCLQKEDARSSRYPLWRWGRWCICSSRTIFVIAAAVNVFIFLWICFKTCLFSRNKVLIYAQAGFNNPLFCLFQFVTTTFTSTVRWEYKKYLP